MTKETVKETDLYEPVKTFLEGQGYDVKGEVGAADIVAYREEDDDPVVVELKARFSLSLFHQAIQRQSVSDAVYVAVPHISGKPFLKAVKNNVSLCRRLGLGLLTVRMKDSFVNAHIDPAPFQPRKSKPRKSRLLREFSRRVGDPNKGGAARKGIVMTAYRQDALRCLKLLNELGPTKASEVARLANVEIARRIMADDHYGWFERVEKGIYQMTPKGGDALSDFADVVAELDLVSSDDKCEKNA